MHVVFRKYLVRRGMRLTRPRRDVIEIVSWMPVRFKADEVIDIACHGRAIVYRTLKELVEAELLELSDGMYVKRGFG